MGLDVRKFYQDLKKKLFKTVGKSPLSFNELETVVMDIERDVNNSPLTYVEGENEEGQVLTSNMITWEKNCHSLEGIDLEEKNLTTMLRRLSTARQHVWQRWKKEYLHRLMGMHRITKSNMCIPKLGEGGYSLT